jgi:hypothetical protein
MVVTVSSEVSDLSEPIRLTQPNEPYQIVVQITLCLKERIGGSNPLRKPEHLNQRINFQNGKKYGTT